LHQHNTGWIVVVPAGVRVLKAEGRCMYFGLDRLSKAPRWRQEPKGGGYGVPPKTN